MQPHSDSIFDLFARKNPEVLVVVIEGLRTVVAQPVGDSPMARKTFLCLLTASCNRNVFLMESNVGKDNFRTLPTVNLLKTWTNISILNV